MAANADFYLSFRQFYEDLTHELLMEGLESGGDEWSKIEII